MSCWNRTVIVK